MGTLQRDSIVQEFFMIQQLEKIVNNKIELVGRAGIEPATLCLKGRYSTPELTALNVRREYLAGFADPSNVVF